MKTKLLLLLLAHFSTYAQVNLVSNGGFENWTNSTTLTNWTIENNVKQNTQSYFRGFNSAQLSTFFNPLPKITTQVPMKAGISYTIKFKYKFVSPDFKKSQFPRIALKISKDGSAKEYTNNKEIENTDWLTFTASFTPDQNLSYDLSISLLGNQNLGFIVAVDEVMVYVQGTEEYTSIPDRYFEIKLTYMGVDPGSVDGQVLTYWINTLTSLDIQSDYPGSYITDLTGIQDFTALTVLNCSGQKITELNLTKNTALKSLNCSFNKLTTLDVSAQPSLTNLECNGNQLTTLDVSKNTALKSFSCFNNLLTSLNLKNGKNTSFYWDSSHHVNFVGNTRLTCIQVDDAAYSNKNWAQKKNGTATYSSICSSLGLEENIFESAVVYPSPTKGEINIQNVAIEKANVYNTLGQLVKSFDLNSGNTNYTINLAGLPKGVYYIYMINQDAASAKKVIVE